MAQGQLESKLGWSLLALRLGIFSVMFIWALDKFFNPGHTAAVFDGFYGISDLSASLAAVLGGLQIALCVIFLAGLWKTFSYGLILIMHGASTFSSFPQYLDPFNNLLFFAAWPMFAACLALFLLRDYDRMTLMALFVDKDTA
ncbi:hypothetical protein PSI9734_01340 [Pseudidiomarina piscicola]|uniref:DoxX n=1 Tax=Pseudidiomarina piscicola TaxID=2614830 RepID=A0A6S6WP04_9GAMM|nr:hypothetical protein [Pseudidiomarina piscicola]CAB0150901.1 hypothetical protein PSI9734_01340 [Pseudidiomarina piscicola]VZT40407.1 hypothetical protein PSI9734_01340 [Pseudomonas aeruginosa]